ncbi:MAG TPA: urease accessory protein UreF [Sphingomonas sp.]
MIAGGSLQTLIALTSPAYPVGGFSYSHGLETAIDDGRVRDADGVASYVGAVMTRGGGWVDAVLFHHIWDAADNEERLDELSAFAAAFRGSSETALESRQMGQSFLQVTRRAWPHALLDAFARRHDGRPVAHVAVGALACAAYGIPRRTALTAWLHATAANLVSAGVRLVPLGQTDGQIAIARLAPVIDRMVERAGTTAVDDLGTAAPAIELASLAHETLYTRLFRS